MERPRAVPGPLATLSWKRRELERQVLAKSERFIATQGKDTWPTRRYEEPRHDAARGGSAHQPRGAAGLKGAAWHQTEPRYGNAILGAMSEPVLSLKTWRALVKANRGAPWSRPGVFAPGIGPDYRPGSARSILVVGKSLGPKGRDLRLGHDQRRCADAAERWMIDRHNPSPFWQFVDRLDPTRRRIAWANVAKIDHDCDPETEEYHPTRERWRDIARPCTAALEEEFNALRPRAAIITTIAERDYRPAVEVVLDRCGYRPSSESEVGIAVFERRGSRRFAILTYHPNAWREFDARRVSLFVKSRMGNSAREGAE